MDAGHQELHKGLDFYRFKLSLHYWWGLWWGNTLFTELKSCFETEEVMLTSDRFTEYCPLDFNGFFEHFNFLDYYLFVCDVLIYRAALYKVLIVELVERNYNFVDWRFCWFFLKWSRFFFKLFTKAYIFW